MCSTLGTEHCYDKESHIPLKFVEFICLYIYIFNKIIFIYYYIIYIIYIMKKYNKKIKIK